MRIFPVAASILLWSVSAMAAEEERIFVGNNHGGTVSVIRVTDFEVIDEFDAVPELEGKREKDFRYVDDLVVSPDGRTLYLSRALMGDIAAFSTTGHELLWTLPLGSRADHFALSPDGKRLFVSMILSGVVKVVDLEKREVVGEFRAGFAPHVIELSPGGREVYVGALRGTTITVADTQTWQIIKSLEFPEGVRPFDITRDESLLYAQLSYMHGFVVYDLNAGAIVREMALPIPDSVKGIPKEEYPNEAAHHGLVLSKNEKYLCVAGTLPAYVAILSAPELELLATIPVGEQPSWIINSLDGRYAYVSSRVADTVSIISYEERKEIKRIPVGDYPQRMTTAAVVTGH